MVCMKEKEPVVSDGGVYILVPVEESRIEKPSTPEDLPDRVMEERQILPEVLKEMQRYAAQYDLNRSF